MVRIMAKYIHALVLHQYVVYGIELLALMLVAVWSGSDLNYIHTIYISMPNTHIIYIHA